MSPQKLAALLALVCSAVIARPARAADPPTVVEVVPLPQQPPPQPTYAAPPYPSVPPGQAQATYPYPYPPPTTAPPPSPWPPGTYHYEERPRHGLVVAGWTLLLIPYALSALTAIGANEQNESSWLFVPVAGPWFTLGRRSYSGCDQPSGDASSGLGCVADVFATMGLIVDGVLQAAGVTLLAVGYLNTKSVLVRDDASFRVLPMRVGSGYGVGVGSTF